MLSIVSISRHLRPFEALSFFGRFPDEVIGHMIDHLLRTPANRILKSQHLHFINPYVLSEDGPDIHAMGYIFDHLLSYHNLWFVR
jgi:hypothetical protein